MHSYYEFTKKMAVPSLGDSLTAFFLSLALTITELFFISQYSPVFSGVHIDVLFRPGYSKATLFSALWPVIIAFIAYCKQNLCSRLKAALIYRYKHRHIESSLATCYTAINQVFPSSLPRHVTFLVKSFWLASQYQLWMPSNGAGLRSIQKVTVAPLD